MSSAVEIVRDEHRSIASVLKSPLAPVKSASAGDTAAD